MQRADSAPRSPSGHRLPRSNTAGSIPRSPVGGGASLPRVNQVTPPRAVGGPRGQGYQQFDS
ncbi:hypothetical protein BC830DRAFT_1094972 [Chytriomyces sp. MP71]|nr:hypothetical protein BC830DRAFT_1094972 [Chytriomyces sp. MP71]